MSIPRSFRRVLFCSLRNEILHGYERVLRKFQHLEHDGLLIMSLLLVVFSSLLVSITLFVVESIARCK